MSKAFTRESDGEDADEIPSFRPRLAPGTRNLITREGAERFENQLTALRLQKQQTPETDAVYRKLESSLRNLQQMMGTLVIAEIPADRDKVAFGATVTIREAGGDEEKYRIVGVDETDPENGDISWISPLARALLNGRKGDRIKFRSPAGERELTIERVEY